MKSHGSKREAIPQLQDLADFRYQLRTFLSFSEAASENAGIAAQQYQLMQVIGVVPGGQAATISYLAERMVLRHNSTVELVDRAVRAGLVLRKQDNEDLRRAIIELTSHGWTILQRLVSEHVAALEAHGGAMIAALEKLKGQPASVADRETKGQR